MQNQRRQILLLKQGQTKGFFVYIRQSYEIEIELRLIKRAGLLSLTKNG